MIELHDLSFAYPTPAGPFPVLRNITLTFQEGVSVAILGANGSGKTPLLRCLNGLVRPTGGDVCIDGHSVRDPQHISTVRQRVGMVFQNPDDQIVSAQVEREVAFGLENLGVPTPDMRRRVADILDRFDLDRYRRHAPHLLSGGERQRLALASVIAMRPRYLLLDEPTALLDPAGRQDLLTLLAELHTTGEVTPLMVTQIPSEAVAASRVVVLHRGQIALDGSPSQVFSRDNRLREIGLAPPLAVQIAARVHLPPPFPLTPNELVSRLPAPSADAAPPEPDPTSPPDTRPIVQTHALRHVYTPGLPTETLALNDLDLSIPTGAIVSLIGPSGSGKSTFAQHLNGLLRPTSGRLTVCDLDLTALRDFKPLRRRVGLIFQFPEAQLFADTVFDDVAFGPKNLGLSDLDSRVPEALQQVGLIPDAYLTRSPLTLSGGEKRRVAIAGVLAMHPDLLIMDEPTAGLDPSGAREIETLARRLKSDGCTLLVITHDMDLAARLSDRIVALQNGRLSFDTTPREAFSDPTRLHALHLDLPEPAHIASALRTKGWPIPPGALTPDALIHHLRQDL